MHSHAERIDGKKLCDLTLQELFKVRDAWNLLYTTINTEFYFNTTHCQRFATLINMRIDELAEQTQPTMKGGE